MTRAAVPDYGYAYERLFETAQLWLRDDYVERYRDFTVACNPSSRSRLEFTIARARDAFLPHLTHTDLMYVTAEIAEGFGIAAAKVPPAWFLEREQTLPKRGFAWLGHPWKHTATDFVWRGISWLPFRRARVDDEGAYLIDIPSGEEEGLVFCFWAELEKTLLPVTQIQWRYGQRMDEAYAEAHATLLNEAAGYAKMALAALLFEFCAQRIVKQESKQPPRHVRRRHGLGAQPRPITVIVLRHLEHDKRSLDHNQHETDIQWTCRWIVGGHWRDQWYPSRGRHRPKWIAPYIKGPEDRPLVGRDRVFRVAR